MAVFWYALTLFGTSMMLTPAGLAQSSLAVPDAMQAVFNAPWAGKLMVFAGWMLLGLGMYAWSCKCYGVAYSDAAMRRELEG